MIVLAHAGHWAVQLIYLFPLAVLVAVIIIGRMRERRDQLAEEGHPEPTDAQPPEDPRNAP